DYALRWTATLPVIDFTPDTVNYSMPIVNPARTIMGYMNALQAMYNGNMAALCADPGVVIYSDAGAANPYPATFPPPTVLDMDNVVEYIRIQTFNTSTGAAVACAAMNIRPPSENQTQATADLTQP